MNLKKLIRIIVGSTIFLLILSCKASSVESSLQSSTVEVSMIKFEFVPKELTIKSGQSVRWINKEKRQYHSVWFKQKGEAESDYLFPDDDLVKRFDKPGIYPYRCGPHPKMIGIIIVQ